MLMTTLCLWPYSAFALKKGEETKPVRTCEVTDDSEIDIQSCTVPLPIPKDAVVDDEGVLGIPKPPSKKPHKNPQRKLPTPRG